MLKLKSSTKTKIPGATALTPQEWHKLKSRKSGTYQVIGGAEGQTSDGVDLDFATALQVFNRAVRRAGCTPESGYRIKLVATGGAK